MNQVDVREHGAVGDSKHDDSRAVRDAISRTRRKRTRQDVLDLNGPRMDGRYNGRPASCPHFRAPDVIPTHSQATTELRSVVEGAPLELVTAYATFCSGCGAKIYDHE